MTRPRTFGDPVIELTNRLGGEPEDVLAFAEELTDAEADALIEALDEAEAGETARGIRAQLRGMGHLL